jgi:pilus assembly protein Flp/PilA
MILNFLKDEAGATALEYGLIAALIAVSLVGAAGLLGESINNFFSETGDTLDDT